MVSNILNEFKDDKYVGEKKKSKRTRSQIGKSSKQKGKRGERHIANLLTEESGLSWIRIPNSGAFVGKSNRRRIINLTNGQVDAALGDIFPPDCLKYRYIIESKFYKSLSFNMIKKGQIPAPLKGWIKEIQYDTESALIMKDNKPIISLLFIKINNYPEYFVFNYKYMCNIIPQLFQQDEEFPRLVLPPFVKLKNIGYGNTWMMTEVKSFIKKYKNILFEQIKN